MSDLKVFSFLGFFLPSRLGSAVSKENSLHVQIMSYDDDNKEHLTAVEEKRPHLVSEGSIGRVLEKRL